MLFLNSLNGALVFDDEDAVITNNDVDPSKSTWTQLFRNNFWGETPRLHKMTSSTRLYYRPGHGCAQSQAHGLSNKSLHSMTSITDVDSHTGP